VGKHYYHHHGNYESRPHARTDAEQHVHMSPPEAVVAFGIVVDAAASVAPVPCPAVDDGRHHRVLQVPRQRTQPGAVSVAGPNGVSEGGNDPAFVLTDQPGQAAANPHPSYPNPEMGESLLIEATFVFDSATEDTDPDAAAMEVIVGAKAVSGIQVTKRCMTLRVLLVLVMGFAVGALLSSSWPSSIWHR